VAIYVMTPDDEREAQGVSRAGDGATMDRPSPPCPGSSHARKGGARFLTL